MAPAQNGGSVIKGDFQVVAWDLDTTGRRLIDEICHIGAYYVAGSGSAETFSQYVMPYKNPNPGARRSFGIKVVSIGKYRMLKDVETGKILKTKSEISALQDFIDWLKVAKANKDGVLLACHEPTRKVLVPLLLEALYRYNLVDNFCGTVSGFVNAANAVEKFGDKSKITSSSLRSLCKTVLNDTNPSTATASDRSKVIINILAAVTPGEASGAIDVSKLNELSTKVSDEETELKQLKNVLGTQGTLRPIFESQLSQRRAVRERAMALRRLVAESGLDYDAVAAICKSGSGEESVDLKPVLKSKLTSEASDDDINELVVLFEEHFRPARQQQQPAAAVVANGTHDKAQEEGVSGDHN